jgi:hypothetical protein
MENLPTLQYNFHKQAFKNSQLSLFLNMRVTEVSPRPIYVLQKDLSIWNRVWKAFYLIMFFDVNPGYSCGCFRLGYHKADVEKIILLQNPDTGAFEWVFFGAHSNAEGVWRPWKDCLFTKDGALRIFVSPTSNAMYPTPECYVRLFGIANDNCKQCTIEWTPTLQDFEDATTQIWSSNSQVVPGINSPTNMRPPPTRGILNWQRWFIALPTVRKSLNTTPTGGFL